MDKTRAGQVTRRDFLRVAGLTAAGMAAADPALAFTKIEPPTYDPLKEYPYRTWEDLYRKEWTWDAVGLSAHSVGCVAGCAWKVYTKGGIPLREEQVSQYPQLPGIPDMNPRGCQKGAVYCSWMLQPDFLKYPLKRVGARGERKWKRISWDEALDEIAEKIIEVLQKHGPGHTYHPNRVFSFLSKSASIRLANLLGGIKPDVSSFVGDLYPGVHTVRGMGRTVSTFDDWFTSDLILMWHKNPIVTRIPDAHFLTEARYNGARLVNISVDYNPSSIHADLYVPIRMGTDSHLAASIVHLLIKEKRYKADFLKEHTDLPFLVRSDTKKYLREADLKPGGKADVFFVWDLKTGKAAAAPGSAGSDQKTLRLDGVDPALEGTFTVNGIPVTTVFELVKRGVADYSPEKTQPTTRVHPSVVRQLTDWIASCKALRILDGYNCQKHFDGFQTGRLKMLIITLIGHHGTTGSIDTTYEGWRLEGLLDAVRGKPGRGVSGVLAEWVWGDHAERARGYYDDGELKEKLGYGIDEIERFRQESEKQGWMPKWQSLKTPKVTITTACNYFRHITGHKAFQEKFLKQCELFVVQDIRLSSAAMFADIVLPAATDYERFDGRETSVTRFIHGFCQPVKPMFERKSDWQISVELARKLQEKARARGLAPIPDPEIKAEVNLATIHDDFTMQGKTADEAAALRYLMDNSKALGPGTFDLMMRQGFVELGPTAGKAASIPKDRPYRPFVEHVANKKPYSTFTGRLQFFLDHDWHLRLNVAVPAPQSPGGPLGVGRYPFVMDYPHTRWGIHSSYRSEQWMLRLQRGVPYVYLNPRVMERKGIRDGDRVRVFNRVGEFTAMAKPWPALPEYIVFTEHGWEQYMYPGHAHYNDVNAEIINPAELIGGYGHVRWVSGEYNPNRIYYETGVDIERA